jgi:hypothetical protein
VFFGLSIKVLIHLKKKKASHGSGFRFQYCLHMVRGVKFCAIGGRFHL